MEKLEGSPNDLLRLRVCEAKKHLMHGDVNRIALIAKCTLNQARVVISGARRGLIACKHIVEAVERVSLENKILRQNDEIQNNS